MNQPDLQKYLIIYYCIIIVSTIHLLELPQVPLGNAMFIRGYIKPLAIVYIFRAIINVSLSFALSYFFGALGASIAILIAGFIAYIFNNLLYRKYLGVSLTHYFMNAFGKTGVTFLITIYIGLLLHFFVPLNHHMIIKLLINGGIVVVVYLICTLLISFNKAERRHYMNIIFELLHVKKRFPDVTATNEVKKMNSSSLILIFGCLAFAFILLFKIA